jgi:hypothetical protein
MKFFILTFLKNKFEKSSLAINSRPTMIAKLLRYKPAKNISKKVRTKKNLSDHNEPKANIFWLIFL